MMADNNLKTDKLDDLCKMIGQAFSRSTDFLAAELLSGRNFEVPRPFINKEDYVNRGDGGVKNITDRVEVIERKSLR
jgi:hypothetical protein